MKIEFNLGIISLFFLFIVLNINAQEKKNWIKENINFSGYIKYMNTSTFQDLDSISNDNLLHNRLNLKVYLNKHFTTVIEMRNRVFWGTSVQTIPNYASSIDDDNTAIDLSVNLIDEPAFLVHLKIDRLYIDYQSVKWQVTLGRQRINWGKNLVWNPNDLFNAYNFVDFDYEERPGTDAVRVQYFTSGNSSIETAINYAKKWKDNTLALKYNFNSYKYDFQAIIAKYFEDYMLGFGWEGAIKSFGVKGELSYFVPQEKSDESNDVLIVSVSLDYYFKKGITINLATLYNSNGIKNIDSFDSTQFNTLKLNAKQLMPNRWSYFAQVTKTLTPAINTSFSAIYAYELKGIFMMPQFSYSISQNWDFDTTAQIFYGKQNNQFSNLSNSVFFRFRLSF